MSNKNFLEDSEREQENSRTWEGSLGRHHFRVRWSHGPNDTRFHFQAPFIASNDPDGMGVPFSTDLGFVWEHGRGVHAYGTYADRLGELRRETLTAVEKARSELEAALATLRRRWNRHQMTLQPSHNEGRSTVQRVRIEYQEVDEVDNSPSEELSADSAERLVSPPPSSDERTAQRRRILEEVRSGSISLEEAERRLSQLG
jgi:hypothetical protein